MKKTLTSILNKQNIKEALFTLFNEYKLIDEFTENIWNSLNEANKEIEVRLDANVGTFSHKDIETEDD